MCARDTGRGERCLTQWGSENAFTARGALVVAHRGAECLPVRVNTLGRLRAWMPRSSTWTLFRVRAVMCARRVVPQHIPRDAELRKLWVGNSPESMRARFFIESLSWLKRMALEFPDR
eukprot:6207412-Pleurochrysis_carterae.AAC.1